MIKVFVDSGSSIKQHEKEKYDVEILPLKILLGDKEYLDGVDLSMDVFYDELIMKICYKYSCLYLGDFYEKRKTIVNWNVIACRMWWC